jgi:hypothetical protein
LYALCGWHQLSACHGLFKKFWSFKFKKSGVRFEVGLCTKTGEICWWNGPYYEPGDWNDGIIFEVALVSMLEYGERCETNGGYWGSAPEFVKCPKGVWGKRWNRDMQQRVRNRQETVNGRLKSWAILVNPFRHVSAAPNSVCCSNPAALGIQPVVFS